MFYYARFVLKNKQTNKTKNQFIQLTFVDLCGADSVKFVSKVQIGMQRDLCILGDRFTCM